jgi:glutamate N-acetyltransferase/amino-acid N-acetyltransferase
MKNTPVPKGFLFSTARASIKHRGRDDMALIYSEERAAVAGTFTRNRVKAAPVLLDRRKVRSGTGRAIVMNSGNANACTGKSGMRDAENICNEISRRLIISEKDVFIASTGVIGVPLPMERIRRGISNLVRNLGNRKIIDAARAIMTTDSFPKVSSRNISVGRAKGTLTGIAKGAGMIAPDMATMLCFLLTDLTIESSRLGKLLKEVVDVTFNRITVDGDMSTNDTVLIMANGAASSRPLEESSRSFKSFRDSLIDITDELSRMIVRDGEGASHFVIIRVTGARTQSDAKKAALTVAKSPLVKTALYGEDLNWGRIMAALGYSGVAIKEDSTEISFNGTTIVKDGLGTGKDRTLSFRKDENVIDINFFNDTATTEIYTCDFTEDYVRLNAEYRT